MVKIKDLKKVKTLDDLKNLGIGQVYCDISYRGGGLGFYADDVAKYFGIAVEYLPSKFGAGCNYLGGGLRGKIFGSDFAEELWEISKKTAKLLSALVDTCVRVYKNIDNEEILNDPIGEGIGRIDDVISAY